MREDSDGTARHPTPTQLCCRGSPSEPVTSLRTGPTEATRLKKLALSPRGTRKRLPPEGSLLPPGWLHQGRTLERAQPWGARRLCTPTPSQR